MELGGTAGPQDVGGFGQGHIDAEVAPLVQDAGVVEHPFEALGVAAIEQCRHFGPEARLSTGRRRGRSRWDRRKCRCRHTGEPDRLPRDSQDLVRQIERRTGRTGRYESPDGSGEPDRGMPAGAELLEQVTEQATSGVIPA